MPKLYSKIYFYIVKIEININLSKKRQFFRLKKCVSNYTMDKTQLETLANNSSGRS